MERARDTREIGGVEYRLALLPPRRALRLSAWLLSRYGRSILSILFAVVEGDIPISSLLDLDTRSETGRALLEGHVYPVLESLDPDDLDRLVESLLGSGVLERRDDPAGDWSRIVDVDEAFGSVWDLFGALGWALSFNFRPTSAAGSTDGTSASPAAATH